MQNIDILQLLVSHFPAGVDFSVYTTPAKTVLITWTDGPVAPEVFKKINDYWPEKHAYPTFNLHRKMSEKLGKQAVECLGATLGQVILLPRGDGDYLFCGEPEALYRCKAIADNMAYNIHTDWIKAGVKSKKSLSQKTVTMLVPIDLWGYWVDRLIEADMEVVSIW